MYFLFFSISNYFNRETQTWIRSLLSRIC